MTTRSTFDIPAIGTPSASIVSTLQPSASSVRRRRDEQFASCSRRRAGIVVPPPARVSRQRQAGESETDNSALSRDEVLRMARPRRAHIRAFVVIEVLAAGLDRRANAKRFVMIGGDQSGLHRQFHLERFTVVEVLATAANRRPHLQRLVVIQAHPTRLDRGPHEHRVVVIKNNFPRSDLRSDGHVQFPFRVRVGAPGATAVARLAIADPSVDEIAANPHKHEKQPPDPFRFASRFPIEASLETIRPAAHYPLDSFGAECATCSERTARTSSSGRSS